MQHLLNITKSLEKIERLLKGSASQEPAVNELERYGQSSGVCVCGVWEGGAGGWGWGVLDTM